MSLFNGAKWKGMTLNFQDAKPDYKQKVKRRTGKLKDFSNFSPLVPKNRRRRNKDT
ncbi:hypothetical protein C2G38_2130885 [Gigaspora rosea]|uniref:Uncharacterized protein n=1 Tax=Gigaspora rosea TaxID=44941 RepID=A0A397TTU3_9GLOM|nr:hypothetical protein C2G38_2130885 [Gigaspora rosea]